MNNKKGRYVMKLLLATLMIRFLAELVSNKRKDLNVKDADVMDQLVRHPAEFQLR
jgi:hypothetical protein